MGFFKCIKNKIKTFPTMTNTFSGYLSFLISPLLNQPSKLSSVFSLAACDDDDGD